MGTRVPTSILVFLFFLSIYSFTMAGSIQYGDEVEKYRVAQSLVERHDFSFRPTAMRNEIGAGGRTYSIYELGQTLLEVPFYILGKILSPFSSVPDVDWITQLTVGLLNPIITAWTCVLLYLTGNSLGFGKRSSWALTLMFGLGTIAWPYSKGFTREPLLTFLLLASFFAVHRFQVTYRDRWLLAAGIASGYLVFTKFVHAVVVPLFLVYVLVITFQKFRMLQPRPNWRSIIVPLFKSFLLFSLPGLLFLALQSLYALIRFGTLFSGIAGTRNNPIDWILLLFSQAQLDRAVMGLVFSPEKSLFLYSPPVLIFLLAWIVWVRTQTKEALLCLGLILLEFATVIGRPDWDGGSWWGPRYLVQVVPLLLIPAGALISGPRVRRIFPLLLSLLFATGLLVQVVGVSGSPRDYFDSTGAQITLTRQLDFILHGGFDSLVLYLSPSGTPIRFNAYGVLLFVVVLVVGWLMIRSVQSGETVRVVFPYSNLVVFSLVVLIEFTAFLVWIVIPYPQVRSFQGDTKFVSGNAFRADERNREAVAMYYGAIERGTNYSRDAMEAIAQLAPRTPGDSFTTEDLVNQTVGKQVAMIAPDARESLFGGESLKIKIPGEKDEDAFALSDWITVEPNTTYELSGWLKTENVYGTGFGVISIAEDNGSWKRQRTLDMISSDETHGWRPFQKDLITLPTTRRLLIRTGLYQTYGTLWVGGMQLAKVIK